MFMTLRQAGMEDADALLRWRNDPVARANFRESSIVHWDDHTAWLSSVLRMGSVKLLIAEVGGTAVGTVRFDYTHEGYAELSWTIASEHRGKGFGADMVRMAVEQARVPLIARIKPENLKSARVAAGSGFSFSGNYDTQGLAVWKRPAIP